MSTPASGSSTLLTMRDKVRKVTARPSITQITDQQVDFYINTFYLYDMPEQLRLFELKTNYVFVTVPNEPTYDFPVEQYTSIEQPVYVAGYQQVYYQDQKVFYDVWPKINFEQTVGTGDGVTVAPVLQNLTNVPVLPNCVTLSATLGGNSVAFIDNGEGAFLNAGVNISAVSSANPAQVTTTQGHNLINGDFVFVSGVFGTTVVNGGPFVVTVIDPTNFTIPVDTTAQVYTGGGLVQEQTGTINYITGALTLNWGIAPDAATPILVMDVPYRASRPTDMLFFDQQLTFRPVPDKAYKVEIEVFQVPTTLMATTQSPELGQWWQYLAYGAALKIFADSGELEEHAKYFPFFEEQQRLVLRRTLQQLKTQRVLTPFAEESQGSRGDFYPFY